MTLGVKRAWRHSNAGGMVYAAPQTVRPWVQTVQEALGGPCRPCPAPAFSTRKRVPCGVA